MCPWFCWNGFDLGLVMGQDPCYYLLRGARADQGSIHTHLQNKADSSFVQAEKSDELLDQPVARYLRVLWWAPDCTEVGLHSTYGTGCVAQGQNSLHSRVCGFEEQPLLLFLNPGWMTGNHGVSSRVCSVFFGEPKNRADSSQIK